MHRFSVNLLDVAAVEADVTGPFTDHEAMAFQSSSLNTLILKVCRKPGDLMAHLHRIYFCYAHALSEPLYAALLDLLIVLDGKGHDLCRRLIMGCRKQLDTEQWLALNTANHQPQSLQGNKFCLFTQGLIGTTELLHVKRQQTVGRDPLLLARDFIEYSQLDAAMTTLEQALTTDSFRTDIQTLLLELYQSTSNHQRFQNQYDSMVKNAAPLIDAWRALAEVFAGKTG